MFNIISSAMWIKMSVCLKAVLIILIVLILFSARIKAADIQIKSEREKYSRNNVFNDSFLDTYFRTSPSSLYMNSILLESNLFVRRDGLMNFVPISRTKLTRNIDFMFEDVPLHNIYTGNNDLSRFYFLADFFYIESNVSDSSEIVLISDNYNFKADTNLRKNTTNINLGAGSQLGLLSGHYFTESNYLKYFIAASYVNSIGIPLSNNTPSDITAPANILKRSDTENGTIYGKMFFDNGTSEVGFSFLIGRGNKTIPFSDRVSERRFYRYTDLDDNLLNFNFKTKVENFVYIRGNVFFKQSNSIFHSYDDSTYTTKNEANSYESSSDGYNYGGKISARFNWVGFSPTTLSFDYLRDVINRKEDIGFQINRYEIEQIALSARQVLNFGQLNLFGIGRFAIVKPLYSELIQPSLAISNFDAKIESNYKLYNNLALNFQISQEHRLPSMQEIFYQGRFEQPNFNSLKSESVLHTKFGVINNNTDFELYSYLFYSDINNIIISESNINRELRFYNNGPAASYGLDAGFKVLSDYGYILLNYTYTEYIELPKFLAKPKHIAEIKLYNTYSFGLRWQFEAEYYSNNFFMKENINNLYTEMLFLLNLRVGLKFLTKNEIFIGGYNLLDTYYESEYGMPGAGFSLFVGISVNI